MVAYQRIARRRAVARTTFSTPAGILCLQRQLAQPVGSQRRQLGHFEHRGVAQRRARRDFFRVAVINGTFHGDTIADADGLQIQRIIEHFIVNRIGLAVHLPGTLRRSYPKARRAGSARFSLVNRQAVVSAGFHRRDYFRYVLVNRSPRRRIRRARSFIGRLAPFSGTPLGRRDSLGSLASLAGGYFRQHHRSPG